MSPQNQKNKEYEIVLGPRLKVTQDKKSNARVINFPFEFPDGERGVLIVCRLEDSEWIPVQDIKSIIINFK